MVDELEETPTPEPDSEPSVDAQGLETATEADDVDENLAVEEESGLETN